MLLVALSTAAQISIADSPATNTSTVSTSYTSTLNSSSSVAPETSIITADLIASSQPTRFQYEFLIFIGIVAMAIIVLLYLSKRGVKPVAVEAPPITQY